MTDNTYHWASKNDIQPFFKFKDEALKNSVAAMKAKSPKMYSDCVKEMARSDWVFRAPVDYREPGSHHLESEEESENDDYEEMQAKKKLKAATKANKKLEKMRSTKDDEVASKPKATKKALLNAEAGKKRKGGEADNTVSEKIDDGNSKKIKRESEKFTRKNRLSYIA